jgi:hypothetical protein
MSNLDIVFPEELSYGLVGGSVFNTNLLESNSGVRHTTKLWSQSKSSWSVIVERYSLSDFQSLKSFFEVCSGAYSNFLFKDWMDFKFEMDDTDGKDIGTNIHRLTWHEGGAWVNTVQTSPNVPDIQLYKTFSYTARDASAVQAYRKVTKIKEGTYSLWAYSAPDWVEITEDASTFSLDVDTGIISFNDLYDPGVGAILGIKAEFYKSVKFLEDVQNANYARYNKIDWNGVSIVEDDSD